MLSHSGIVQSVHASNVWHWVRALRHTNDGNLAKCRVRWKATIKTWKSAHSRKWWSLSENCESGKWTITRERRPRLRCLKSFEYKMKWRISCSRSWLVDASLFLPLCVWVCSPREAGLWQSSFMCGKWNPSIHSVLVLAWPVHKMADKTLTHTQALASFQIFRFLLLLRLLSVTESDCKSLSPNVEWDTRCACAISLRLIREHFPTPNTQNWNPRNLKYTFVEFHVELNSPIFPEIIFNPNLSLEYHGKHKRRVRKVDGRERRLWRQPKIGK